MTTELLARSRELDQRDIRAVLARNHVARIAFQRGDGMEIRPIHYVFHDGYVYGRAEGPELPVAASGETVPVAFEVDEIRSVLRWRSVTAGAEMEVLDRDEQPEEWEEAVTMLRRLVRDAFCDTDPLPHLCTVFRLRLEGVMGRAMEGDAVRPSYVGR